MCFSSKMMGSLEQFNGFIIKPINDAAAGAALHILSFYQVEFKTTSDGDGGDLEIIVLRETREGDLRLCEMAFQWAFRQANGRLCPVCKADVEGSGEGFDTCGHLVFNKPIKGRV
jgi:hypothetical protein